MTNLGMLPGDDYFAEADGINDAGQVVGRSAGFSGGSEQLRAFLYDDGVMTDFERPAGARFGMDAQVAQTRLTVPGKSSDSASIQAEKSMPIWQRQSRSLPHRVCRWLCLRSTWAQSAAELARLHLHLQEAERRRRDRPLDQQLPPAEYHPRTRPQASLGPGQGAVHRRR